jgi:hypothetical protein
MNKIAYLKIGELGNGLTRQMFTLTTSIILAIYQGTQSIIIDNFYCDNSINETKSVCEILDLSKINIHLKKYNITLFDKNNTTFKLEKVMYGIGNKFINITNEILDKYYIADKNILCIKKGTNFNLFKGDPCPGVIKKVEFTYYLNDMKFFETHNEYIEKDIIVDIVNSKYVNTFSWIDALNVDLFEEIITYISFNNHYLDLVNNIKLTTSNNCNIIHLKLENDDINYWANMNNMENDSFKKNIEDKYIEIIQKYIKKTDNTIVLSDSMNNNVINYLKNNNYLYFIPERFFSNGSELNKIIDLLISEKCNNVFIGNFNTDKIIGSPFSYFISKKMNDNVKQMLIDLDSIMDEENIYFNKQTKLINYSYLINK